MLLAAASLSFAETPNYFPLSLGNSWAYKATPRFGGTTAAQIDVQGVERFRDQEYFRVGFLGRTVFLRPTGTGIAVFNTAAGTESAWLPFDSPDGQSVPVDIEQCTRAAKVESRAAKIKTPAGEWENAIQFSFEQSCADAGLTQMFLVPDVGIVSYETTTFGGPVRYDLIYVRAGSAAGEASQTSFTVALDAPTYKAAESIDLLVRLTLRTTEPVTLTFPSGQRYDLRVWNDKGEVVYVWAADKLFPQIFSTERLGPGERTFAFTANVPNLSAGRYVAEIWMATQAREFVGTVGFNVVQ